MRRLTLDVGCSATAGGRLSRCCTTHTDRMTAMRTASMTTAATMRRVMTTAQPCSYRCADARVGTGAGIDARESPRLSRIRRVPSTRQVPVHTSERAPTVWSGSASPVVDAVAIWCEAVSDSPEDGLGAAVDADLAVAAADVGLDGVGAEVGEPGHVGVAEALGDEGEDLGLAVGQAFAAARPVQAVGGAWPGGCRADDGVPVVDRAQGVDEVAGRQRLGQVSADALVQGALDEVGGEVPGVDDDASGVRVADEHRDLVVVGLGLGERVVEHDVDDVVDRAVGVELGDDDLVAVLVEDVG